VGRALLEVLDRIAALRHHGLDQAVRFRHRPARIVDEAGLRHPPPLGVAIARRLRERAYVQPLPPLLTRLQLGLGESPVLGAAHGAVVLGAELLLQPPRAPTGERLPQNECEHDDDSGGDQDPDPCGHEYVTSWFRFSFAPPAAGAAVRVPMQRGGSWTLRDHAAPAG